MTRRDRFEEVPPDVLDALRELNASDVYGASDALLARIQRSRANGARGLLPLYDVETAESATRWWRIRGGLAAAGVAAIAAIVLWGPPHSDGAGGGHDARPLQRTSSASVRDTNRESSAASSPIAELLSPWPRVAYAQTPQGGRAGPFEPLSGLHAERVKLGRRAYVRLSGNAYHELLPHEMYELDVDTAHFEGKAVFRLVSTWDLSKWMPRNRSGTASLSRHDTLWLDRVRLLPVARHSVMGPLEVTQRVTDTVLQQRTRMDTRIMGLKNPPKPVVADDRLRLDATRPTVVSEAMLRVLLQAAPLTPTWRASVGVVSDAPATIASRDEAFRNLRVAASDTLQTFSGRYPVWRVEVDNGRFPEVWFVSQETGEVLRINGPWNGQTYPRSESHLIRGFTETQRLTPVKRSSAGTPSPPGTYTNPRP